MKRRRKEETNDSGVGHGLASSEDTNEEVHLGHTSSSEGESEGDGERKTLGDGNNNDGNGDDEDLDERLRLVIRRAVRVRLELDEEADHEGEEEEETGGGTEFGDEFGEGVELELERGVLRVALQTHHDASVERVATDGSDDVLADALEDLGTGDEEAIDLAVRVGGEVFVRGFANGVGLSRCARLVAADVVTGEEDTIDRDNFSRLDEEDVADEDVVDAHEAFVTGAEDLDVAIERG